jgi:hypothetical protein
MTTDTTYRSNSNIRRTIEVRFTEPQFDALLTILAIGEERADEHHVPSRVKTTAERAIDLLQQAWESEEAA